MTNCPDVCVVCGSSLFESNWAIFPMVAVGPTDPVHLNLGLEFHWKHEVPDDSTLMGVSVHVSCVATFLEGLLIQAKVDLKEEDA